MIRSTSCPQYTKTARSISTSEEKTFIATMPKYYLTHAEPLLTLRPTRIQKIRTPNYRQCSLSTSANCNPHLSGHSTHQESPGLPRRSHSGLHIRYACRSWRTSLRQSISTLITDPSPNSTRYDVHSRHQRLRIRFWFRRDQNAGL